MAMRPVSCSGAAWPGVTGSLAHLVLTSEGMRMRMPCCPGHGYWGRIQPTPPRSRVSLPWSAWFTSQGVFLCACVGWWGSARRMTGLSLQPLVSVDLVPEELPELRVQSHLRGRPLWGMSVKELDCGHCRGPVNATGLCFSAPRGTIWNLRAPCSNLMLCSWTSSEL